MPRDGKGTWLGGFMRNAARASLAMAESCLLLDTGFRSIILEVDSGVIVHVQTFDRQTTNWTAVLLHNLF